jgi:VanZ like family
MTRASLPYAVAAAVYLALVGYLTFGTVPWQTAPNESARGVLSPRTWLDPDTWAFGSDLEFAANVLMFVPVGVLLCLALPRVGAPVVALGAVGIAAAIEVGQIPLERVSDPRDLVANAAGAAIGVVAGMLLRRRLPGPASVRQRGDAPHDPA